MAHPLVDQLRFARSEFRRGLEGISDEEARRRFLPMNCLSWNIGHLAAQEQRYWLLYAQGEMPLPEVDRAFRYGSPASTPALDETWSAWETITTAANPWLDAVTTETLLSYGTREVNQLTTRWDHCCCATSTTTGITPARTRRSASNWVTPICQTSSATSMTKRHIVGVRAMG